MNYLKESNKGYLKLLKDSYKQEAKLYKEIHKSHQFINKLIKIIIELRGELGYERE